MTRQLLSVFALATLLLCTACAVSPSGTGDWMHEVNQTPTYNDSILYR